jgi:hypothetical protein
MERPGVDEKGWDWLAWLERRHPRLALVFVPLLLTVVMAGEPIMRNHRDKGPSPRTVILWGLFGLMVGSSYSVRRVWQRRSNTPRQEAQSPR